MHCQLNISNQDLKRLHGPASDFVILCNKIPDRVMTSFIANYLSKSNPNHSIEAISLETLNKPNNKSDHLQLKITKLLTKSVEGGQQKIYIIQFNLNPIQIFNDLSSILKNTKIETGIIKFLYKEKWPVMLCKFHSGKSAYIESLKKAISIKTKEASPAINEQPQYTLRVSHHIQPDELKGFKNATETKKYILSRLRVLEHPRNEKVIIRFNTLLRNKTIHQELIQEVSTGKIIQEISRLPQSSKLHQYKQFEIYIIEFNQAPNTMLEIGRLREMTFRKAKEGTGLSLDLDSFDPYYQHLFIWDTQKQKIAGAYRLIEGHKIMPLLGKKGFYISTLFKMDHAFNDILVKSVELGRSFITPQYQKSNFLLLLMWKSLYSYIFSKPENQYIIGPVSISEEYSKISRLLIMDYLKKYYGHSEFQNLVKPRKPFRFIRNNAAGKIILRNFDNDIHKLDKLISEIQYNAFKVPVLIRQYLKQNAKVIAFNKDPLFNNVLDALLILDHQNMSGDLVELMEKEMTP